MAGAVARAGYRDPRNSRRQSHFRRDRRVLLEDGCRHLRWRLCGAGLHGSAGRGDLWLAEARRDARRARHGRDDARPPYHGRAVRRLHGGLSPPRLAAAIAGRDLGWAARHLDHLRAVLFVDRPRRPLHRAITRKQAIVRRACRDHRRRGRGDPQPCDLVRAAYLVPRNGAGRGLGFRLRDAGAGEPQPVGADPFAGRAGRDVPLQGRHGACPRRLLARRCHAVPGRGHRAVTIRRMAAVVAFLTGVAPMPSEAKHLPTTVQVDIPRMPVGASPVGFSFGRTGAGAAGQWRVVEDPTALGGKAIAQLSQDRTDYRFPLAIYQPLSPKDVEVTVRFKPVEGRVDQAGGIAVRLISPDDYYVVRANALENNVRFYKVVHGRRIQLEGIDIPVAGGHWHMLGLRAEGNRFTVSYDGRVVFAAEDDTYADTGQVALWTKADSVTFFDTIGITPLE